jgi:hypothetical protein
MFVLRASIDSPKMRAWISEIAYESSVMCVEMANSCKSLVGGDEQEAERRTRRIRTLVPPSERPV